MKISDRVFLLESTRGAYAYLIIAGEVILVDTGLSWQGKGILRELESLDIKPRDIKHIILTHYDLDHIGNAAMLQKVTGARVWASQEDLPYITGSKPRPGFKRFLPYIFRVKKPESITELNIDERLGGIEIIPSPSHTPGHVCLLFKGILFAGDLVKSQKGSLIPYPSGWNWDSSILSNSLEKVFRYPIQWVCPAHGRPVERKTTTLHGINLI